MLLFNLVCSLSLLIAANLKTTKKILYRNTPAYAILIKKRKEKKSNLYINSKKQRGSGKSTFTKEWDVKMLMRFNIYVGVVTGGLYVRKKKKKSGFMFVLVPYKVLMQERKKP